MTKQTRQERRQLRKEVITAHIKDEAKQIWLSSPRYHLELAAAQLAITLTKDDTPLLIKERIAEEEDWGTDCHPSQLLSRAELANVDAAMFVVDSIKRAIDGLYEGMGYNMIDQ